MNQEDQKPAEPEIITIQIKERKKAVEINSRNAGRYYLVDEIELGTGQHKKAIPYNEGDLKKDAICKAMIIALGRVRIIL